MGFPHFKPTGVASEPGRNFSFADLHAMEAMAQEQQPPRAASKAQPTLAAMLAAAAETAAAAPGSCRHSAANAESGEKLVGVDPTCVGADIDPENLKLAVEAADLAGVGGTDIDGARSLLRELLNPTTQDTVAAEADEEVEARHTGGLQVVEQ